jgi:hypothetical protein
MIGLAGAARSAEWERTSFLSFGNGAIQCRRIDRGHHCWTFSPMPWVLKGAEVRISELVVYYRLFH